MAPVESILDCIGKTPVVRCRSLFPADRKVNVFVKLERQNPCASIKDRVALKMIEDAEARGTLKPGVSEIIEPTSGNTGIGLAMVCAVKKYKLTLVMPESMSLERRRIMLAYGAHIELTPRDRGMTGSRAIQRARQLASARPSAWIPGQFDNASNVEAHAETTAQELLSDFPDGIDFMITGVGTGGHITGCARVLKQKFPKMKVFGVEPSAAPVLSGGKPAPHKLQGIGAGFIPKILQTELLDGIIQVDAEEAFEWARRSAMQEGILIGISSGASLAAVAKKLPEIPDGATVLTFNYDTGERYLSVEGLFPIPPDAVTYAPGCALPTPTSQLPGPVPLPSVAAPAPNTTPTPGDPALLPAPSSGPPAPSASRRPSGGARPFAITFGKRNREKGKDGKDRKECIVS
eukprot:tig00000254_g22584.t1